MGIEKVESYGKTYQVCNGTYYHAETSEDVIHALELARSHKTRVRLFYGDVKTGKSWHEENDVTGTIGRSMGPVRIPLIIHSAASHGGPSLLDHCIVGIATNGGKRLYKHATLDLGTWTVRAIDTGWVGASVRDCDFDLYEKGYRSRVFVDGTPQANFKGPTSLAMADRYVAFMTGKRLTR